MAKRLCKVKGCGQDHRASGYCVKHYMQKYRGGNGYIEFATVKPVFDKLIAIYGTKAATGRALGVTKSRFGKMMKSRHIKQPTLDRGLALLAQHEEEGRKGIGSNVPLEVVDTEALAKVLRKWVVEYMAERPTDMNTFAGPSGVIAFRAGLSERTVSRYINNNDNDSLPWVDVNVAEKLLIAIDEENCLRDGTLEVFPNPKISTEEWIKRMKQRGCI